MKIRISSQSGIAFYAIFCVTILMAFPAMGARECLPPETTETPTLDTQSQRLMDALTGRIEEENKRINILYHAARNTEADAGVRYFLAQRALLAVSGEMLQRGNFDKARQLLGSVEVDSPVAVEAALLLADSWRMQGNPKKARDWYLRAGQQFPHERLALKGMLAAARAMESETPGIAATLYDRVHERALAGAQVLEQIPEKHKESGLNWLLSEEHGLPAALHGQLSRRILSRGDQSLMALEDQRDHSEVSLRCVIRRAGDLEEARSRIAGKMEALERSLGAIETRTKRLDQRIEALESAVTPGDMNKAQIEVRKELVRRKNERKRLEGQLVFLRQNRERLPRMLQRLQGRIQRLYARHHAENKKANRAIHSLVETSIDALRKDFLDIAGTSRDDKARLMERAAEGQ